MKSQSREKNDPNELNNPIPYSVSAIILGLTLWSVSYIYWTSHAVEEANEVNQYTKENSQGAITTKVSAEATTNIVASTVTKNIASKADGKSIYSVKCSACHQSTGKGLPGVFPPLKGSKWVTTDNLELPVQIIAKGLMGKITVAGSDYNGVMPAFEQSLSTAELAALVSYIRGDWGNKSTAVSAEDVAESLAKHSEKLSPWAGEIELIELVGSPK